MLHASRITRYDTVMAQEIERKFLVNDNSWKGKIKRTDHIIQGYLANTDRGSIRVRISNNEGSLSIKSMTLDISRLEYDYPIPLDDARTLIANFCMQPVIEKLRHYIEDDKHIWEIDVFEKENKGLIIAEIELTDPEEVFHKPDWVGAEVSDDPRYYNVCLVEHPYQEWEKTGVGRT